MHHFGWISFLKYSEMGRFNSNLTDKFHCCGLKTLWSRNKSDGKLFDFVRCNIVVVLKCALMYERTKIKCTIYKPIIVFFFPGCFCRKDFPVFVSDCNIVKTKHTLCQCWGFTSQDITMLWSTPGSTITCAVMLCWIFA